MSILFVILHSHKTKDRREVIKSTWGKHHDCFFCSDYNEPPEVYKMTDKTDHGSAELKHMYVFGHLLAQALVKEQKKYLWYFFCDDDTFVNTKLLIRDLNRFDPAAVHGQAINCWAGDPALTYPSGGAGYLLHASLLQKMTSIVSVPMTGFSDVTFGLHVRDIGIPVNGKAGFYSQPPSFYGVEDQDIHKQYTFHYIKTPEEVNRLHHLCEV